MSFQSSAYFLNIEGLKENNSGEIIVYIYELIIEEMSDPMIQVVS